MGGAAVNVFPYLRLCACAKSMTFAHSIQCSRDPVSRGAAAPARARPGIITSTARKYSQQANMLRRLAPLVTTILLTSSRVRPSASPARPLSVSSLFYRRDFRVEMGNQVSNKGDDPTYSADKAPAPELTYTEEELRSRLTADEYRVTQEKGR